MIVDYTKKLYNNHKDNFPLNNNLLSNIVTKRKNKTNMI